MRRVKELLRLGHELGYSKRQIAQSIRMPKTTVGDYLARAEAAELRAQQHLRQAKLTIGHSHLRRIDPPKVNHPQTARDHPVLQESPPGEEEVRFAMKWPAIVLYRPSCVPPAPPTKIRLRTAGGRRLLALRRGHSTRSIEPGRGDRTAVPVVASLRGRDVQSVMP